MKNLERFLRIAFIVAVATALAFGVLAHRRSTQEKIRSALRCGIQVRQIYEEPSPVDDDKKLGLLMYVKRWLAETRKDPVKWLRLKEKFKKFLSSKKGVHSNGNK